MDDAVRRLGTEYQVLSTDYSLLSAASATKIVFTEVCLIEEPVNIPTPDGSADGCLYHIGDGPPRPGIIFLTDIGGIRNANRGMAQRLASEGYTVLVPNVFYRTGKPPVIDWPMKPGDEHAVKRMGELTGPLGPEAVGHDANAYIEFLSAQPFVSPEPFGVVGYCFTGAMAMRIAAARPDKIGSAASFHGGRLCTGDPASPHLLLPQIKARLYFGHAVDDKSMPQDAIKKFNQALKSWGGNYESEVYAGAHHGWTVPDSPSYNEPQAERAFEKLKQALRAGLQE
jgi:carboxymethylenebutenolidase